METKTLKCSFCQRLVVWLALTGVSLSACSVQTERIEDPVPASYFGMHIHRLVERQPWLPDGNRLTPWPDVPFGSLRLWDAYVAWPNLQPNKTRWHFATLDKYLEMASAAGVEVLLPLGLSPTWASTRPEEKSSYKPGNAAEPANLEDWRVYVRQVATRYKGRIRAYEIWNEINLKGFYSGDLDTMVTLARIAYEEIKAVDPDALVVSPSVTGDGRNPEWLARYLSKGGGKYADVIGYHFYVPKHMPEAMLPVIKEVRTIMRKYGVSQKPLWNTEAGWWIDNLTPTERLGAAGADWRRLDQQTAAAYVSRALILNWAAGVSRFYWYAWDNRDMGLYDVVAQKDKPAAHAYARTASWLTGAYMRGCNNQVGQLWRCELVRGGKRSWLVWHADGQARDWRVTDDAMTYVEFLNGNVAPISFSRLIRVDGQPVLLKSEETTVPNVKAISQ